MRSLEIVFALVALVAAAPAPVNKVIDFDPIKEIGGVMLIRPLNDVSADTVHALAPQEGSTIEDAAEAASTILPREIQPHPIESISTPIKRAETACTAEPSGTGPKVDNPDTATAFSNHNAFHTTAKNAVAPSGYTTAFVDLSGSSESIGYMGLTNLPDYDTDMCASYCKNTPGCIAFNIYYERDPSLHPGPNCANPASLTNIKCTQYSVPLSSATVTNVGQFRANFEVVISGSNGYNLNNNPAPLPGFTGPVQLDGAIDAPLDPVTGQDTYMGYHFFPFDGQPGSLTGFDPSACTAYCDEVSEFDIANHLGRRDLANVKIPDLGISVLPLPTSVISGLLGVTTVIPTVAVTTVIPSVNVPSVVSSVLGLTTAVPSVSVPSVVSSVLGLTTAVPSVNVPSVVSSVLGVTTAVPSVKVPSVVSSVLGLTTAFPSVNVPSVVSSVLGLTTAVPSVNVPSVVSSVLGVTTAVPSVNVPSVISSVLGLTTAFPSVNVPSVVSSVLGVTTAVSSVAVPSVSSVIIPTPILSSVSLPGVISTSAATPSATSTSQPRVCNQVNAFVVSKNKVPQGMVCSLYTEAWAAAYGTNKGQQMPGGYYDISSSQYFAKANYRYPPICDKAGCSPTYAGGNCGGYGYGTCGLR